MPFLYLQTVDSGYYFVGAALWQENCVVSRFSTSEYFRTKRLSSFALELSAEIKWNW